MESSETSVIVSACLFGTLCRYNGQNAFNYELVELLKGRSIISICPEMLAGPPSPRPSCNIHGDGGGEGVWNNKAKIIGSDGLDYTNEFTRGAKKGLEFALKNNVSEAYLKSKSPTCGRGRIYSSDGTSLIQGNGIFTALLLENAIMVHEID